MRTAIHGLLNIGRRSGLLEIMDVGGRSDEEVEDAYRLIRRVNRYLFGTRVVLSHLEKYSKRWRPGETIRILDVASGAADIPAAIARWAQESGFRVEITALDLSAQALEFARRATLAYPEIRLLRGDIFNLPFRAGSFDYAISSMFFHHLNDKNAARALRVLADTARRGVIVNDLTRSRRAYLWIYFLSRFTPNPMFRNDAPLSVLRGFRRGEAERMIREAGADFARYHRHFAHRFAIAGEKG